MACKTQTQIGQAAAAATLQVPKKQKKKKLNKIHTHTGRQAGTHAHTLDNKNEGKRVKTKHAKNLQKMAATKKKTAEPKLLLKSKWPKRAHASLSQSRSPSALASLSNLCDGDLDVTYKLNARGSRLKAVCLL